MKTTWQFFSGAVTKHAHWLGLLIITSSLLVLALVFTSCGGSDDDPEPTNVDPKTLIVKTWKLSGGGTIVKDGTDVSADYAGLELTFVSAGTYTSKNGGHLFRASGTWRWKSTDATVLLLDGELEVNVKEITATNFHSQFNLSEDYATGGRSQAVVGPYEVTLKGTN
ncbi:hypothetical protein SAMN04488109_3012 [Chryseolinea serpens]|uniref:Lipocalin-like domain-containing protein n=1 Tax=Chryseolinea serpens TaxID=947013 RepID=A0A1M5QUD5_9BACT|nr:hypothetical protein [Chryseolinea serpens]SHH17568.1 hypothetical protein SAMN04488109_3012 [Chryseolinea serpens]